MAKGKNGTVENYNRVYLVKGQSYKHIFSDNISVNQFVIFEAGRG